MLIVSCLLDAHLAAIAPVTARDSFAIRAFAIAFILPNNSLTITVTRLAVARIAGHPSATQAHMRPGTISLGIAARFGIALFELLVFHPAIKLLSHALFLSVIGIVTRAQKVNHPGDSTAYTVSPTTLRVPFSDAPTFPCLATGIASPVKALSGRDSADSLAVAAMKTRNPGIGCPL